VATFSSRFHDLSDPRYWSEPANSQGDVNFVVTEFGGTQLRGKSASQHAREMISIAHPDFRAELTTAAKNRACCKDRPRPDRLG
jgi:acyl-CoA hydrolase